MKTDQMRLKRLPDPNGELLAGWILQSLYLVQKAMVERVHHRRKGSIDLSKIEDPSLRLVDFAAYRHRNRERMAVKAATAVSIGCSGQPVRRLYLKSSGDFHDVQRIPRTLCVWIESRQRG